MYADKKPRVISYHDTWISLDPVHGCPYQCVYCVLRHANHTGKQPQVLMAADECVRRLIVHPFFIPGSTPLAVGNETDMFHPLNREYLLELLSALESAHISNPIGLITKAPLNDKFLKRIKSLSNLRIVFFLSYSGLGTMFEPNFTDQQLRDNFQRVKTYNFPLVHYWRPLLLNNTETPRIRDMLMFVSKVADASVIIGLKLHPELNRVLTEDGRISIPDNLINTHGEWLEEEAIERIYTEASRICPDYPVYRHTACALASVLSHPNHTATVYRKDICLPSHCPVNQRVICQKSQLIPDERQITHLLSKIGRNPSFQRLSDRVIINDTVSQEEFSFLLHALNCPLEVHAIRFDNLYRGDIYKNQEAVTSPDRVKQSNELKSINAT